MKQKTGRKLLGVLLTLVMVLGLVPGMGLTAFADTTPIGTAWESDNSLPTSGTYYLTKDVNFSGQQCLVSSGMTLDLNGHSITGNAQWGIFRVAGGTFTLEDSKRNSTDPNDTHRYYINSAGLGVVETSANQSTFESEYNAATTKGTFVGGYITGGYAKGGTINGNSSGTKGGGAILCYGGGLIMNGGTLIGNQASRGGAIGEESPADITINHGLIVGNVGGKAGGINVEIYRNGTMTLKIVNDVKIINNRSNSEYLAGGVCINAGDSTGATLEISGSPVIIGNTYGASRADNVYLRNGAKINITGPLGDDAMIGVTMATLDTFTSSSNPEYNDPTKFSVDNSNQIIGKDANGGLLMGSTSNTVTVTPSSNMTKTTDSGEASQTVVTNGVMTNVVYTAEEGYYFPTDYSVTAVNGISVTRNSYTQITVSGTPTADAAITLTAPTAKKVPTTDDFLYSGPGFFPTYDGTPKTATVVPKEGVTGMGQVTVKYYSDAECGAENVVENPTDAGEYYVGITVAEGDNYSAVSTVLHDESWKFTINRAAPVVNNFSFEPPSDLSYNGNEKTATVAPAPGVSGMGAITVKYYSDQSYSTEVSPTNVGTYYVGITTEEGDNYSAVSTVLHDASWQFTINRATPIATNFTYNAPSDLTYDGNAKTATVVQKEDVTGMGAVTVKYYSDQWRSTEVTPTNVGTYYVGITLSEGNNYHNASSALYDQDWQFTISKQGAPTSLNDNLKPTANTGLTYTGNELVLVTAPASALTGYTVQYSLDGTNWGTELPKGTNAGDYTVKVKYVGDENHEDFNGTDIAVTIGKVAAPTLTDNQKPTAKIGLTYTGSDQALVTVPSEIPDGYIEVQYALGTAAEATQPYTTSIPAKTEAGTYYVWYKVVGDSNHNDTAPECVESTIRRPAPSKINIARAEVTADPASFAYDGTAKEPALKVVLGGRELAEGTDYVVSFSGNVDAGTATATVTGKGRYTGAARATFAIEPADVSKAQVELEQVSFAYDGNAKEPAVVSVTLDGRELAAGTDYSVSYENNVKAGTATAVVTGKGNYEGTAEAAFSIEQPKPPAPVKTDISKAKVTLAKKKCIYDGKAQEPAVASVVLNGKTLAAGTDYTVSYENNTEPGAARAIVTGKGAYEGTAKASFKVALKKARLSATAKPAEGSLAASWAEVPGAEGYELQWRAPGGQWQAKSVSATSATVKGLKPGSLCDVRVRAVAGKAKGAWSPVRHLWLARTLGVTAKAGKSGSVDVTWKANAEASAGYLVVARYAKGGKNAAKLKVAAGETSATFTTLKSGKKVWVLVAPLRTDSGKTFRGVLSHTTRSTATVR